MSREPARRRAVLLMAHGSPDTPDDVEAFLRHVRGRPSAPGAIEEVRQRYVRIGGRSPLLDWTRAQAAKLEAALSGTGGTGFDELHARATASGVGTGTGAGIGSETGTGSEARCGANGGTDAGRQSHGGVQFAGTVDASGHSPRVYVGMRHWHPFIQQTLAQIRDDGADEVIALPMAPQPSRLSTGAYFAALQAAREAIAPALGILEAAPFGTHPRFLDALSARALAALDRFPRNLRPSVHVLFTAHSLPERILAEGDPYVDALRTTIDGVLERIGPRPHQLVFQSAPVREGWLGPDVLEALEALAARGIRDVLLQPVGFTCDHVEVLYDLDVVAADRASTLGIRLERAGSLNDHPGLIDALADRVREHL